jgi:hypothetical protein
MSLPKDWAIPEDFASLFQYFWHRDFPIGLNAPGAKRIDWTIHIGLVVRNIADLMGLVARFERGGRKDALLRSKDGDEVALEWEWQGIEKSELRKLKSHEAWPKGKGRQLKYAVLVTYVDVDSIQDALNKVQEYWKDAHWPLLLILITAEKTRILTSRRKFRNLRIYLIDNVKTTMLREAPALPWQVNGSRWYQDKM